MSDAAFFLHGNSGMSLTIYCLLGLLIGLFELYRKKYYQFDAIFFANATYFLFYSMGPIFIILFPEWRERAGLYQLYEIDLDRIDLAAICFFGYLFLLLGWLSANLIKVTPFNFQSNQHKSERLLVVGLALGLVAYFSYVSALGGVVSSILNGSRIRYGGEGVDQFDLGKGEVFKHLILFNELVFLYQLSRIIKGDPLDLLARLMLAVSGIILVLFILSVSSRGAFVGVFIAAFVLWTYGTTTANKVNNTLLLFRKAAIFMPLPILVLIYGKQFFSALPELVSGNLLQFIDAFLDVQDVRLAGDTIFLRDSLLKESSHGMVSLSAVIDHFVETEHYLWFQDYLLLPLHVIPKSLLGLSLDLPPSVSAINTEILQGNLISSIPPSMLAMLIYNIGIGGIFLMFFYGAMGSVIQRKFILTESSPGRDVFLFYFAYYYGSFIGNADIKVFIFSAFPLVMIVAFLYVRKGIYG